MAINFARDLASNGELLGFNTGFQELNQTIAGWCKPDLCIIAARPGAGRLYDAFKCLSLSYPK